MKYDVVVIGSGMSGMIAAAKAVSRNKNTLIITKGQGILPLTTGCIDIWGYQVNNPKAPALNPYEEIQRLAACKPEHPYARVLDVLPESIDFLKKILKNSGYSLTGSIYSNQKVLTALGTERVTALAPESMVVKDFARLKRIIAVGFNRYPDFFPQMFLDNLNTIIPQAAKIPVLIDLDIKETVRSNHLSLLLERQDILAKVEEQIRVQLLQHGIENKHYDDSMLIVLPAVLGKNPGSQVAKRLRSNFNTQVIGVPGLPPSIPGEHLQQALMIFLKRQGVEFRHNSEVVGDIRENGKITYLSVKDSTAIFHSVEAGSVILAAGSFIGGGLTAKQDSMLEPIFKLPVINPRHVGEDVPFLSLEGQGFLEAGVEVDDKLRPLKGIDNLYAAGSILAHGNYASEKSGLGIAVATGYKAGSLA